MAILERTFDRRSPSVQRELAAFREELRALEWRVAPAALVTHTARAGELLRITVVSAERRAGSPGGSTVEAWRPY
ncbi:MAG: hypothetical protein AB1730_09980 [Myxococcota bacterium]|jgi:hypothetical protein